MKLYEIAEECRNALDNLQLDEDGVIVNYDEIEALQAEFDAKTEAVACYIKELKADAEAIKTERDNLNDRMKAKEKKAEWLTDYLANNMKSVGKSKFETSKCKLSFRKSTSVLISDEAALPRDFVEEVITYKPDKMFIKDALKHGNVIPGAELVEKTSLQIK